MKNIENKRLTAYLKCSIMFITIGKGASRAGYQEVIMRRKVMRLYTVTYDIKGTDAHTSVYVTEATSAKKARENFELSYYSRPGKLRHPFHITVARTDIGILEPGRYYWDYQVEQKRKEYERLLSTKDDLHDVLNDMKNRAVSILKNVL